MMDRQLCQNWRTLLISNLKPDLHSINVHTKFDENPFTFKYKVIQVIVRKQTYDRRTDTRATNVKP